MCMTAVQWLTDLSPSITPLISAMNYGPDDMNARRCCDGFGKAERTDAKTAYSPYLERFLFIHQALLVVGHFEAFLLAEACYVS